MEFVVDLFESMPWAITSFCFAICCAGRDSSSPIPGPFCLPVLPVRLSGGRGARCFQPVAQCVATDSKLCRDFLAGASPPCYQADYPLFEFFIVPRWRDPFFLSLLFSSCSFHYNECFSVFQDGMGITPEQAQSRTLNR